jgi:hypothetical protein
MKFTDDTENDIRSMLQSAESCRESGEDPFTAAIMGWVGPRGNMSQKSYSQHIEEVRRMLEKGESIMTSQQSKKEPKRQ